MTQQTFTTLFETYGSASMAVAQLEAAGVSPEQISLVSGDAAHGAMDPHAGTATGASLGTLLGGGAGLLAGFGMLAIPGFGPLVAAGWLASTLVGAGVGAAAGGLVGALTEAGLSDQEAEALANAIQRGGTLVTVQADSAEATRITAILDGANAADIADRDSGHHADRTDRGSMRASPDVADQLRSPV